MNDFEVLSRDAESGEPVEPKRDAETPVVDDLVKEDPRESIWR